MDPISKQFVASIHQFCRDHDVPMIDFARGITQPICRRQHGWQAALHGGDNPPAKTGGYRTVPAGCGRLDGGQAPIMTTRTGPSALVGQAGHGFSEA
jgi:hypothetical protein